MARNDEIGELASNVHNMRHRLFTDTLTGAANRSALTHILASWTTTSSSGAQPAPFTLLFIDLDHFKPLNDLWGHDNGDRALVEVVQRIRSVLRSNDVLARLGGDEFVVGLQGAETEEQAQMVADKIQQAMAPVLGSLQGLPPGESVVLSAAIGWAIFPADGCDPQILLKHADRAMYCNKSRSRGMGPWTDSSNF